MKVNEFISKIFELKYVAHVAHLQTTSYAKHIALNELYTTLEDHLDTFIECYQGEFDIVYGYTQLNPKEGQDIIKVISEICEIAESFKTTLSNTYLQQIIDNMLELMYQTKYKLKKLS